MKIKFLFLLPLLTFCGEAFSQDAVENNTQSESPAVPFAEGSSEPIEITADTLTVKRLNEIAVFSGNVEAIQGNVNLRSEVMTVYYKGKKDKATDSSKGQNTISKIEVERNVFLTTANETAQGDRGVYDVDRRHITLSGAVVLTQKDNVVKGNRLEYDLASGKSELFSDKIIGADGKEVKSGRVRGVFVPENKP